MKTAGERQTGAPLLQRQEDVALAAEMHSGFAALREEHPMNLRAAYFLGASPERLWHHYYGR